VPLVIQKYGGTSVANIACIKKVAGRIARSLNSGESVVAVVSAMAGETNRLLGLLKEVTADPVLREYDALLATGECVTSALLSTALNDLGVKAKSYSASQIKILTENAHKESHILAIEIERLQADLQAGVVPVIAGFQGVNEQGEITTLGRGGSDATAVALAAALGAKECQIFTDVDGVCSADPRIVPEAELLSKVSYDEMLQMASLGAKVLQTQSVELACQNNVALRVGHAFKEQLGTELCHHVERLKSTPVTGVVSKRDVAKITLRNVPHYASFVSEVLGVLVSRNIKVDMLVQHHDEQQQGSLSLVVERDEFVLAKLLLSEFVEKAKLPAIVGGEGVAKLSLVGHGLNSHSQVMTTMFTVLAEQQIDIFMLACSEIKISVIVEEKLLDMGVEALHNAFELSDQ
jgi:aspartate kinase